MKTEFYFALWVGLCGCTDYSGPLIAPSATEIDLGRVFTGSTRSRDLVLTNLGGSTLRIGLPSLEGDRFFVADPATFELLPGGIITLTVGHVAEGEGFVHGTLVVPNDSKNAPNLRIDLSAHDAPMPACTDGNQCTDDRFDPQSEECVFQTREGACDDQDACTRGDHCVDGVCEGSPVTCEDGQACTQDSCDPATGCRAMPDDAACDDDNPCTRDVCSLSGGCEHEAVPNGTACGVINDCLRSAYCSFGTCELGPVPEGQVCNDGDPCTVDDVCIEQSCVGRPRAQDARLVASVRTFGSGLPENHWGDPALVVSSDRILFADSELTRRSTAFTLGEIRAGGIVAVRTSTVMGVFFDLVPVSRDAFVALGWTGDGQPAQLTNFEIASSGRVRIQGSPTPSVENLDWARLPLPRAVGEGVLYTCSGLYDLRDPRGPKIASAGVSLPLNHSCEALAVDVREHRLFVGSRFGDERLLFVFDLNVDPTRPEQVSVIPVSPDAAGSKFQVVIPDTAIVVGGGPSSTSLEVFERGALTLESYVAISSGETAPLAMEASLVLSRDGELIVYDLADPAAPSLAASHPLRSSGRLSGAEGLLLVSSPGRSTQVLRLDSQAPSTLDPVTSPYHGSTSSIWVKDGRPFVTSADSVREIRGISSRTIPTFSGRGVLDVGPVGALFQLGNSHAPVRDRPELFFQSYGDIDLYDIQVPASPQRVGSIRSMGAWFTDRSGQLLLEPAMVWGNWWIDVHTLEGFRGGDVYLSFLSSVDVDGFYPLFEEEKERRFLGGNSIIDLRDPHAPRVEAWLDLPESLTVSGALSADTVLVLASKRPNPDLRYGYDGDQLVRYRVIAPYGAPEEQGRIDLPASRDILAFDGSMALVATSSGVTFVDTRPAGSGFTAAVSLPQDAVATELYDGRWLLVAHRAGLSVLEPFCPEPMLQQ